MAFAACRAEGEFFGDNHFFLFSFFAQAQKDTVNLTLKSAELLLFERNLTLIAEKYNIDIAEAQIQQAKLFENPTILLEQNIYNRLNNKYFDVGKNGEAAIDRNLFFTKNNQNLQ